MMTLSKHLNPRLNGLALTLASVLFLVATTANANEHKAYPIDQGQGNASFSIFRATLLDAVVQRDVKKVVSHASKTVKLSFGGHFGRQDFHNFLTLSPDDLSDEYKQEAAERREGYWDSLEEVLRMGGKFTKTNTFEAPYTWTVKLADIYDPFTTYFVIGKNVPVRDRPNKYGNIITSLDYNIVIAKDGGAGTKFIKVKLPGSDGGFIAKSNLRSAVDARAIFKKSDGRWLIDTFIKGD